MVLGIVTLVMLTMILIAISIMIFTSGIGYALALTIYLSTFFCVEFFFANWIINIWHKYFMIFHTAEMWTGTDQEIMKVSRFTKVGLTLLAFYMDAITNDGKSLGIMYLTRSTYET